MRATNKKMETVPLKLGILLLQDVSVPEEQSLSLHDAVSDRTSTMRGLISIVLLSVLFSLVSADWETLEIYDTTDCKGDFKVATASETASCRESDCSSGTLTSCSNKIPNFKGTVSFTSFSDGACTEGKEEDIIAFDSKLKGDCITAFTASYKIEKKAKNCIYTTWLNADCSGNAASEYTIESGSCQGGIVLRCGAGLLSVSIFLLVALVAVLLF
eukprot:TRINITY_DN1248_c0_g1_i1.p1 TRINITY_DN1248_c0_g1~~TRINITY_DN1248_c0_g1_i1.p1  ORF type:complete len:215 (-),score=27.93 TRINITY_DN1248_c0_g1_i1:44-688(-)